MIYQAPSGFFQVLITVSIIGAALAAVLLGAMLFVDWRRGRLW